MIGAMKAIMACCSQETPTRKWALLPPYRPDLMQLFQADFRQSKHGRKTMKFSVIQRRPFTPTTSTRRIACCAAAIQTLPSAPCPRKRAHMTRRLGITGPDRLFELRGPATSRLDLLPLGRLSWRYAESNSSLLPILTVHRLGRRAMHGQLTQCSWLRASGHRRWAVSHTAKLSTSLNGLSLKKWSFV